jgi:hypothetical protein
MKQNSAFNGGGDKALPLGNNFHTVMIEPLMFLGTENSIVIS